MDNNVFMAFFKRDYEKTHLTVNAVFNNCFLVETGLSEKVDSGNLTKQVHANYASMCVEFRKGE